MRVMLVLEPPLLGILGLESLLCNTKEDLLPDRPRSSFFLVRSSLGLLRTRLGLQGIVSAALAGMEGLLETLRGMWGVVSSCMRSRLATRVGWVGGKLEDPCEQLLAFQAAALTTKSQESLSSSSSLMLAVTLSSSNITLDRL